MKKQALMALRVALPIGFGLAFGVVACGGNDSGGDNSSNAGSSSGGSSSSAGSSSMAGSSSKAGGTSSAGSSASAGSTGTAGSGSGSTGDFDTGLPASTPISSLTDDQFAGLCSKFDDFYSTGAVGTGLKNFNCSFSGFLAAALTGADTDAAARAACKMAYDACIAAPTETTTSDCAKPTGTCTATVGEMEACVNDSAKYIGEVSHLFPSCAELTLADLMDTGEMMAPAEPASCTTLDAKCPGGPTPPGAM